MGAVKELWMEEIERICDDFAMGGLDREEAMQRLIRYGLDPHEAAEMLDQAIA